jgi:hypothetical protein
VGAGHELFVFAADRTEALNLCQEEFRRRERAVEGASLNDFADGLKNSLLTARSRHGLRVYIEAPQLGGSWLKVWGAESEKAC